MDKFFNVGGLEEAKSERYQTAANTQVGIQTISEY